eukprot:336179_1
MASTPPKDDYLFKEASYLTLFKGPYYKPWHLRFQKKYRQFVETHIMPNADKWDESGNVPLSAYKTTYEHGFYSLGYPVEYGGQLFENKYELDAFAAIIKGYEFSRIGASGIGTTLGTMGIGLPPILNFGSEYLKQKYAKPVLTADKIICLAISEPAIGSDVSKLKTNAIDDPNDNNYFIVNGEKFFISNGNKSNYYTTAVRYNGKIIAMLIDRDFVRGANNNANGQILTSRLKTQGWKASDTAYITFKDVRVHKQNIIGSVEVGWKVFMTNFNNERYGMAIGANGLSRTCLNDAILYAKERKTFGKYLIKHQVIRHKLVEMIRKIESTHYMIERCAYLLENGKMNKQKMIDSGEYYNYMKYLSALCSITKVQSTKSLEFCAREAMQIFGGRGYLRSGRGRRVERIYREVRVYAIGGGSEEILIDLAARQAKL